MATVLVFSANFSSCKMSARESKDKNGIFLINLDECKVSLDLKLSDLIENCKLIPLETNNASILNNNFEIVYIDNDYIIIDDRDGIYKFLADGKFVKKILKIGRGPEDLSVTHSFISIPDKKLLIINDFYTHYDDLLCYNIESDSFLPPIKKCFPGRWGDFTLYNDSVIIGSLYDMSADSNPYAIFFQDFKGNFISGIDSKRIFVSPGGQVHLQRMLIFSGDKQNHVKYIFNDTLFSLGYDKLSPYMSLFSGTSRIDPPNFVPGINETRAFYEKYENQLFMIFGTLTYLGEIKNKYGSAADYIYAYYLLDKSTGNYGRITSFTDDLTGKVQTCEDKIISFPKNLPGNKIYTFFYPSDLKGNKVNKPIVKGFPESLYSQLNKLREDINEIDNPILLIGTPKARIRNFQ